MKLRLRLVLTLGAATIPLIAALLWLRADATRRATSANLRDFMLGFASEERALEACEAAPERWPRPHRGPPPFGHGPPPEHDRGPPPFGGGPPPPGRGGPPARFWVYGTTLMPATIDAPELERTFVSALGSDGSASRRGDRGTQVLVRLPWSSEKCAYLLAEQHVPPELREGSLALVWPAALALSIMFVLWLSLSSVVQRLHRLAEAVRTKGPIEDKGSDEIGHVAQAFAAAIQTIEAREQNLKEQLANTAHDIMIPLTVLQGTLTKLEDGALIRTAREEAHYIGTLLGNLAAVAKLEGGARQLHKGESALEALVERAVERHRMMAEQRGVELEAVLPGDAVNVLCDPTLTEQCVSNLVYNAVRYTEKHVTVVLNASKTTFTLDVIDDGPGMSDDERARALERGFRSQRARRENPDGNGLGLSIARAVAEQHGWTLALANADGGGLKATINGPRTPSP